MKKYKAINLLIIFMFVSGCGMNESVEGFKNNYDEKSTQIIELKDYFNTIVPLNHLVRIQFNSASNIDFFVYKQIENSSKQKEIYGEWGIDLDSDKKLSNNEKIKDFEVVKSRLNWNRDTFKYLYKYLNNANCIGICNNNPVEIEYGFMGMALLSYLVFDENLTTEQQEEYSDDCMLLFYKENIVLHFGSGATGSLCSPLFKRK